MIILRIPKHGITTRDSMFRNILFELLVYLLVFALAKLGIE